MSATTTRQWPKLMTGCYLSKRIDTAVHAPIRTSLGLPRWRLHYPIAGQLTALTPQRAWLGMDRESYEKLYRGQLDRVGVQRIAAELERLAAGKIPVVLCFCNLKNGIWCHRRIFAEWWHERTGETVEELDARPPMLW